MNRTLKEATVRRHPYDTHAPLEDHLAAFLDAYHFARRLKTLRGLTPYDGSAMPGWKSPTASALIPST